MFQKIGDIVLNVEKKFLEKTILQWFNKNNLFQYEMIAINGKFIPNKLIKSLKLNNNKIHNTMYVYEFSLSNFIIILMLFNDYSFSFHYENEFLGEFETDKLDVSLLSNLSINDLLPSGIGKGIENVY